MPLKKHEPMPFMVPPVVDVKADVEQRDQTASLKTVVMEGLE